MKSLIILVMACLFVASTPSCTSVSKPTVADFITAITPATTVLVTKKPALVAPLKQVVATLQKVTATDSVTPSDLLASFSGTQQKYPEAVTIIELVSTAYQLQYKPDSNNLAVIASLATAIQNGLPADPPATSAP